MFGIKCVNGHDRCAGGPTPSCPYCEFPVIEIYGRTAPKCVYCDQAKQFCLDNELNFVFKDIVDLGIKDELFERMPGVKTVPQIFVDGRHIGGYTEFVEAFRNEQGE